MSQETVEDVVWVCDVHGVISPEEVFTLARQPFCSICLADMFKTICKLDGVSLVRRKKDETKKRK